MKGFIYKGSVFPNGDRVLIEKPLADSTAFSTGDSVKMNTDNVLVLSGAGGALGGHIVGFKTASGAPVTDDGAGSRFEGDYTTPVSNTVVAVIDVSKDSVYSVTLDAARGTTGGSDDDFVNFDLVAASDQLDESTIQAAGTSAQYVCLGDDDTAGAADNSILVRIQESQVQL